MASHVDALGASDSHGGKSLHDQAHGASFISLLQNRFTRSGCYLMDEPEAALSPQRQLGFLVLLRELVTDNENIQFIIATHSPILLAYPGAQILSLDGGKVHQIEYRDSQPFQLLSRFISAPERYMNALISCGEQFGILRAHAQHVETDAAGGITWIPSIVRRRLALSIIRASRCITTSWAGVFFGKAVTCPLLRMGHFPERILKHKLYPNFTGNRAPRYRVPEIVPIPDHFARPSLPII